MKDCLHNSDSYKLLNAMNIRDFKYLVAVADLAHFGKAAERCFVSQPTLSAQLKKMEETLNTQLFERSNNTFWLRPQDK